MKSRQGPALLWPVTVLLLWAVCAAGTEPVRGYSYRWSAAAPLRIACWSDDPLWLDRLGRHCMTQLANRLHREHYGGIVIDGNVRYGAGQNALADGRYAVIETDPVAWLLADDLAETAPGDGYEPLLQLCTPQARQDPCLVAGPGMSASPGEHWQGVRVGIVDRVTPAGGLAQLAWLVDQGVDFRADVRFVECGSPGDALQRLAAGLCDVIAVPVTAAERVRKEQQVLAVPETLLPRMYVVRGDLRRWRSTLEQELRETLWEFYGEAAATPLCAPAYRPERERWARLADRLFHRRRAFVPR